MGARIDAFAFPTRCGSRTAEPRESSTGNQEDFIPGLSVPRTAVFFQMPPSSLVRPKWWASLYLSLAQFTVPRSVCRLPVKLPSGV